MNLGKRHIVLFLLCSAATIAYMQRNCIGVLESTIREELNLTKSQTGLMMSWFFYSYAFMQIPTSWISRILGNRLSLAIVGTLSAVTTAAMSLANGLMGLLVPRFAKGIAQAGIFPNTTVIVGNWFPRNGRGLANGAIASAMSIGGAVGSVIASKMLGFGYTWQNVLMFYSVLGILWVFVFYYWFRDLPEDHPSVGPDELKLILADREKKPEKENLWKDVDAIFFSPATWWICGQQLFRAAGYIFFASWFATYLQEARGISKATSGILVALPLMMVVCGSVVGGATSDYILKRTGSLKLARKGLASTCNAICGGFVFLAYFVDNAYLAVALVSLGTLCYAIGGPCAYTITIDLGGKQVGTLFACMNMVGNLGAGAFISIVGSIMARVENESEAVQIATWNGVFVGFGVLFIAAAACWLMINTNGTIVEQYHRRRKGSKA